MFREFRYTLRQLGKNAGFTTTAVLTLALGIGANVAVFSVMNAILLNPSGVPHPDGVVALRAKYASPADLSNINLSGPDFADAVAGKDIFTSAAILDGGNFNYSGDGTTPERLVGAKVSWQWFDVFWARPYLGRVFRPEEDQPGAEHEVVLSYSTWRQRFGSDRGIIGRPLELNRETYRVIGVMTPDFAWPNQAELWVPLALPPGTYYDQRNRYNEHLFGVARLRPGVTLAQADSYLHLRAGQSIASEGENSYGKISGWGMFALPLVDYVAGDLREPLLVLLAAVGTVLLIACANIAGLQLARASGRQREVSIQIALGAGRRRLMQQAFMESLLLAAAGIVVGLVIARTAIPALLLLAPKSLMQNISVHITGEVLFFVAVVGVACVLLCGVAPAWQMTRARWFQALQESGRSETSSRGRQRLRSVLVISEIGLAMLLLVGAGLLLRSMERLEQVETGFDPGGVMSGSMSLPETVYKSDEQQTAFFTTLEQQLANIPGVTNSAIVNALPFSNSGGSASFAIEGQNLPPNSPPPHGNVRTISAGYFSTLRIPLLRGRVFNSGDRANTQPVAVIDDTLARRYWPNQDPVGKRIFKNDNEGYTIVGIVKHAKASSLEADTNEGFYYLCLPQRPRPEVGIMVRTAGSHPESLASAMQAAVRAVDPNQPLYDMKPMQERVDASLVGRRFLVVLLSIFAGLALFLAALGLYGVISYSVRLRTRELGIRLALGAKRADVLRLILARGMQLAAVGLGLGLFATFVAGQALSSLLYHVSLFNPLTLAVTSLILASTVLLACYLPARRAAALDPMRTLREE